MYFSQVQVDALGCIDVIYSFNIVRLRVLSLEYVQIQIQELRWRRIVQSPKVKANGSRRTSPELGNGHFLRGGDHCASPVVTRRLEPNSQPWIKNWDGFRAEIIVLPEVDLVTPIVTGSQSRFDRFERSSRSIISRVDGSWSHTRTRICTSWLVKSTSFP